MEKGGERSEGVSGNVIVNNDQNIKTNSYSHRGHDSVFVPKERKTFMLRFEMVGTHPSMPN